MKTEPCDFICCGCPNVCPLACEPGQQEEAPANIEEAIHRYLDENEENEEEE